MQAVKFNLRKPGSDAVPRRQQAGQAHVNGGENSGASLARLLAQQVGGFFGRTRAQLYDAAYRSGGDDGARFGFEQRVLGAGQIVFRQVADPFKEIRPAVIVKVVGLEPARMIPEGSDDRAGGIFTMAIVGERPYGRFRRAPEISLLGGEKLGSFGGVHPAAIIGDKTGLSSDPGP